MATVCVECRHRNGEGDIIGITQLSIIYVDSQNILTSQAKIA